MLQCKNINVWKAATQIDMAGDRLEIAFDTLYPGKVGMHVPVHTSPVVSKACAARQIYVPLAKIPPHHAQQPQMRSSVPC